MAPQRDSNGRFIGKESFSTTCSFCGKPLERHGYRAKFEHHFCDQICMGEYAKTHGNFTSGHDINNGRTPWNDGLTKETDERVAACAQSAIGREASDEAKRKMSASRIGMPAWNKGLTKDTDERVNKISEAMSGSKNHNFGKPLSDEAKQNLREKNSGSKSHFWKGGITTGNALLRQSPEYKEWRLLVYKRDFYTCQECGQKHVNIVAHHIKPFAEFEDLRYDIDNGVTLCRSCHARLHKNMEAKL